MSDKKTRITRKLIAVAMAAAVLAGTGLMTPVGDLIGTGGIPVKAAVGDIVESGSCGNHVTYTLDSQGTLTISGSGEIKSYNWGASPFYNKNIKKAVIEDGVTKIGRGAFYTCTDLTEITIPDSMTVIDSYAFYNSTGLTSIKIPDSVTSVGEMAFYGCTGLTSVIIGDGITSISRDVFNGCSGLTNVTIGNGVTTIEWNAFFRCTGLTEVTIPDNVITIGWNAFFGCDSLKNVTIGNSVTTIGASAFSCCTNLESVIIPDSVTAIDENAFYSCKSLKKLTLGNHVKTIGNKAFSYCEKLTEITIPNSVTSIGNYTFYCCKGLTSVIIPNSVKKIGTHAFEWNRDLTSAAILNSKTSIGYNAFAGCKNITIHGYNQSTAQVYANNNDIPFVELQALENRSEISADKIALGGTVTINAQSVGGVGDCTYAVLYKKKTDTKWTVKQNYSENSIIDVKPAKATDYDICVKVKDESGVISKKFFEINVVDNSLKNNSAISAEEINKGDTVTVYGSAAGGAGDYTYAVLYKKKSETAWTVRQGYKDNSEIIVRPYTNTDYDICIKVKDEAGTISKKYFTVTVK